MSQPQAAVPGDGDLSGLAAGFATDLDALGLPGDAAVLVQASYSRIGRGMRGGSGPDALLAALLDRLGPHGTLVAYVATPENSQTSPAYRRATAGLTDEQRTDYNAALPPFDPATTPASPSMGVVSESLRRRVGARRSSHPQTSFVALGREAELITDVHPVEEHLGLRTPLGRLYERDGYGLLIGVSWPRFTPFHLADYLLPGALPRKTYHAKVLAQGSNGGAWVAFEDLDLSDGYFGSLGRGVESRLGARISRGRVGDADALLVPIRAAVDAAVELLSSGEVSRDHLDE